MGLEKGGGGKEEGFCTLQVQIKFAKCLKLRYLFITGGKCKWCRLKVGHSQVAFAKKPLGVFVEFFSPPFPVLFLPRGFDATFTD